jgi:predicted lipid carrier protein YhbT
MAALVAGLIPILPRAVPKALIACWLAMVRVRNAQLKRKRERVWRRIVSEIVKDFKVKFPTFILATTHQ